MAGHLTLHDARASKNLSLSEVSARTALSPAVVRKIDEGRFDELPPGLYARSYVKSFAAEVGLDPVEALKAVEHLLPGAPDPLPVMRELKGPTVTDRFTALFERLRKREEQEPKVPSEPEPQVPSQRQPEVPLHLELREEQHGEEGHVEQDHGTRTLHAQLLRLGAATVDAIVLLAMNGALVLVIALGTGVPPSLLMKQSLALAGLCAVPTVLYFVLFNGIAGRTLGGWLCRMPEPRSHPPLTLVAILRRSIAPGSGFEGGRDGLSRPALVGGGE